MPTRTANARWTGDLAHGEGSMQVAKHALGYDQGSRFGDDKGTNPEALIGAAHAGCLAMELSHALSEAGHEVRGVEVSAEVRLVERGDGFVSDRIQLDVQGDVEGIDEDRFHRFAHEAKAGCPVSKAQGAVPEIGIWAILQ